MRSDMTGGMTGGMTGAPLGDHGALSMRAAARQAGAALALYTAERSYSFAELATLTEQRMAALAPTLRAGGAHPVVGSNTLDTLLTLYALLELGVAALLLHPRLTAAEQAAERDAALQAEASLPPDAAAVLYTSGTTGRARGAVLTRAALLASAEASAANLGWQADDCWLLAMPAARVGGLSIVTRCLAARRAVALAPAFDAALLPQWLARWRVTQMSLVPTMLSLVLDAHPGWMAPPHLRVLLLGGAAAPDALLARAAARRLPIVVTYGSTETCSQVVATPYARRFEPAAWRCGRPLPGVALRVDGQGRILVRGAMRMAGYLGEPPLAADDWFDTGDLGSLDAQGCLHLHARRADLIVTGGENVYPAEVERVLEACPGIDAAAVFGLADATWGQTVAAALVAGPAPPSTAALWAHLQAHLAPHKRPRQVCFVPALPHNAAGKLDRLALPALAVGLQPLRAPG
ncbi:MAG: o-succinylbenzoate--CoA ligase [Leptothrix sp. (in: Bacteria)]|nr:o-succinylbenzoate--CoA ligase [Leptothrix sp. (in: b-proteobacteria)]